MPSSTPIARSAMRSSCTGAITVTHQTGASDRRRFPYLDLPTNKDFDLSVVPSGIVPGTPAAPVPTASVSMS